MTTHYNDVNLEANSNHEINVIGFILWFRKFAIKITLQQIVSNFCWKHYKNIFNDIQKL